MKLMMRWQAVSPQVAGLEREGGAYVMTEGLAFTFLSLLLFTSGTWTSEQLVSEISRPELRAHSPPLGKVCFSRQTSE